MLTPTGEASLLGTPIDQITQASLHSAFPGAGGTIDIPGSTRSNLTWLPEDNGVRVTAGVLAWTLAQGGTVAWVGLWAGAQFRGYIPWGGTEQSYFVQNSRVLWPVHGMQNGQRVVFLNGAPVGASEGVGYYVVNATQDDFQVSASSGGAPMSILPALNEFPVISKFAPVTFGTGATVAAAGISIGFRSASVSVQAPTFSLPTGFVQPQSTSVNMAQYVQPASGVSIVNYALDTGTAFPVGVTMSATTGLVTVSPTASGTTTVRLRVRDSNGVEAVSASFPFAANAKPVWTTATLNLQPGQVVSLNGLCQDPEGQQLSFAEPATLPAGFQRNGAALTVPQTAGMYSVSLSASDGVNPPVLVALQVTVTAPPVSSGSFAATLAIGIKQNTVFPIAGVKWNRWLMDKRGGIIGFADADHGEAQGAGGSSAASIDGQQRYDDNSVMYFNDTATPFGGIAPGQTGYLWAPRDSFRKVFTHAGGSIPPNANDEKDPIRASRRIRGASAEFPCRYTAYKICEPIVGGKIRFIHGVAGVTSDADPAVIFVIPDGAQPFVPSGGEAEGWSTSPFQGAPYAYAYPDWAEYPNGLYVQFVPNEAGVPMSGSIGVRTTTSYAPYSWVGKYDNVTWLYSVNDELMYWVNYATQSVVNDGGGNQGIYNLRTLLWTHGNADWNPYVDGNRTGTAPTLQTNFWWNHVKPYRGGSATDFNCPGAWNEFLDLGFHTILNGLWYLERNPAHLVQGAPRRTRRFASTWAAYPWTRTIGDKDSQGGSTTYTNQYMNSGCCVGPWGFFVRPQRFTSSSADPSARDTNPNPNDAEFWAVNLANPGQYRKMPHFPNFYLSSSGGPSSSGPLVVYHPPTNCLIGVYKRLWKLDLDDAFNGVGQWVDVSPANWPVNGFVDVVGGIKKSQTSADPNAYEIVFMGDGTGVNSEWFNRLTITGSKLLGKLVDFGTDITYDGSGAPTPFHGKHLRFMYSAAYVDADTGKVVFAGPDGGFVYQFGGDYRGVPYTNSQVAKYPIRVQNDDTDSVVAKAQTSRRAWAPGSTYRGWRLGTGGSATTQVIEIRNAGTSGVGPVIDTIPIGTLPGAERELAWNAGIVCSAGIYISNPNTLRTCYAFTNDGWATDSGRQDQWRAPARLINGRVQMELCINPAAFYPLEETEPDEAELSPWHPDGVGIIKDKRHSFWMGAGYYRFAQRTMPRMSINDGIMAVYRIHIPAKSTDGVARGDAFWKPPQNYLIGDNADRVNVDDIFMGNAPPNVINGASNAFSCYWDKEDVMMMIGQQQFANFYIYKFQLCDEGYFSASVTTNRITWAGNTLVDGDKVQFYDGTPPAPLAAGLWYDVLNSGASTGVNIDTFQLADEGSTTPIVITGTQRSPSAYTVDVAANRILCPSNPFSEGQTLQFVDGRVPRGMKRDTIYEAVNRTTSGFQVRKVGAATVATLKSQPGPGARVTASVRVRRVHAKRTPYRWTRQLISRPDLTGFIALLNGLRRSTGVRSFTVDRTANTILTGNSAAPHHLQQGDVIRFIYGEPPAPLVRNHDYQVLNPTATSLQVGEIGSSVVIDITVQDYTDNGYDRGCVIQTKGRGNFSVSSGRIAMTGHGWITGDRVKFVEAAPPAPLVQNVEYEVTGETTNDFAVQEIGGGGAITLTAPANAACRIWGPPRAYNSSTNTATLWSGPQEVIGDNAYISVMWGGGSGAYRDGTGAMIMRVNLIDTSDVEYAPMPFHWVRGFDAPPANPGLDDEAATPTVFTPQSINELRYMKALGHLLVISPPSGDYVNDEPVIWWYNTITKQYGSSQTWDQLRATAVAANPANDLTWPATVSINRGGMATVDEKRAVWIMLRSVNGSGAKVLELRLPVL